MEELLFRKCFFIICSLCLNLKVLFFRNCCLLDHITRNRKTTPKPQPQFAKKIQFVKRVK